MLQAMFPSIAGTLLSFFLQAAAASRIFFLKRENKDALSLAALASFLTSALNILAWNAHFASAFSFAISFVLLLINLPALHRIAKHSYTDKAHPFFIAASSVILLVSITALSFYVYFLPVVMQTKKYNAREKFIRMHGSFERGFTRAKYFQKTDAFFYEYEPATKSANDKNRIPVLFIPDKRADAQNYRPYFLLLAERGCTVIAADFFPKDEKWFHSAFDFFPIRRLAFIMSFFFNKEKFENQKDFFTFNISNEFSALEKYAKEIFGDEQKFCIACDGMANEAATAFARKSGEKIASVFPLDANISYKTAHFGFLEQTEPLFAFYLGFSRDKNLFAPKALADETIKKTEVQQ